MATGGIDVELLEGTFELMASATHESRRRSGYEDGFGGGHLPGCLEGWCAVHGHATACNEVLCVLP